MIEPPLDMAYIRPLSLAGGKAWKHLNDVERQLILLDLISTT
jgi:hypothetical protein